MTSRVRVMRQPIPNASGMLSELVYETLTGITAVRRRFYRTMLFIAFFAAAIAFAAGTMFSSYVSGLNDLEGVDRRAVQRLTPIPIEPAKPKRENKRPNRVETDRRLRSSDP